MRKFHISNETATKMRIRMVLENKHVQKNFHVSSEATKGMKGFKDL